MLASEINYRLNQNTQLLNSFVYSNFEARELWLQFDRIVDKFIDAHLKPEQELSLKGVDELQINIDNLRLIKVLDYSIPLVANAGSLPVNYRNKLNDRSIINLCGVLTETANRFYGDEELPAIKENPFIKAKVDSPLSRIANNQIIVTPAVGQTISTVIIDYIRVPVKLYDINDLNYDYKEFPDECLSWLIDLTRNRILELVDSSRIEKAIPESTNFGVI